MANKAERAVVIPVSDEQIRCLETAGEEATILNNKMRNAFKRIISRRKRKFLPATGESVHFNSISGDADEMAKIFLGMASSLRKRGEVTIRTIYEKYGYNGGRHYIDNIAYCLIDGTEVICPRQANGGHWGVHNAVAHTLFDSDNPDGTPIKPKSSSLFDFDDALRKHGSVILTYDPTEESLNYSI